MAKVITVLPELTGEEMIYVQKLITDFDDEKARTFASVYRARRKDPTMILVLTLLGFLGFAGIQRMVTDQVGMGIVYLLTLGLCFIGTIVDLRADNGETETFTILGAWDTDPENGILSYLAPYAMALRGKKVGEKAKLSTGEMEITGIRVARP